MTDAPGWDVVGHDDAVDRLAAAIESGRVGHAYLITGPEGIGKTTLAIEFARALLCLKRSDGTACGECDSCRRVARDSDRRTHPDLTVADVTWQASLLGTRAGGTRQQLSIEAIRWLRQDIVARPILSRWKIQIIDDADRLSHAAPEAFLKTLEEPPRFAVIILVATSAETLSETIRSRCQHVHLGLVSNADIVDALRERQVPDNQIEDAAAIARGRIATALAAVERPESLEQWRAGASDAFGFMSDPLGRLTLAGPIAANHTKNRERTFALLEHCTGLWRDALLYRTGVTKGISYPGMRQDVEEFAARLSPSALSEALHATRRAAHDLDRNFQARIAILAMIDRWPSLGT